MKTICLIVCVCFFCLPKTGRAQLKHSIKEKNKNCCNSWCFGTSAVPLLSFVNYNSFFMNEKVKFTGIKFGTEVGEKVRFGFGYYWLGYYWRNNSIALNPDFRVNDTLIRAAKLNYWNLFFDYIVYEDFCWELSVPLGMGNSFSKVDTVSSFLKSIPGTENIESSVLATVGFDCEFRFVPWLGVGAGVGYRKSFATGQIREKLDAPFYAVKAKIFLGYLFKAIFMKNKLEEEREAFQQQKAERRRKRKEDNSKKEIGEGLDNVEGIGKPQNDKDY